MGTAFGVSLLLGAVTLTVLGRNEHGLDVALMLTGRWAFILFWPAYAGAGVAGLLGRGFGFFKRYGREFGLALAAAMVVHVGLILWLCAIGAAPGKGVFVFFGAGLGCIYALALFSLPGLQRRLGRRAWRLLRLVAMNFIAFAFATDLLKNPFGDGPRHFLLYAPFAVLSVAGFIAYAYAQLASMRRAVLT